MSVAPLVYSQATVSREAWQRSCRGSYSAAGGHYYENCGGRILELYTMMDECLRRAAFVQMGHKPGIRALSRVRQPTLSMKSSCPTG